MLLLVLLAFVLILHPIGSAGHPTMIGACLTALAIAGAMLPIGGGRPIQLVIETAPIRGFGDPGLRSPRTGRPPPEHGNIMRT